MIEFKSTAHDSDDNYALQLSPWLIGQMERDGFHWWENLQNSFDGKCIN